MIYILQGVCDFYLADFWKQDYSFWPYAYDETNISNDPVFLLIEHNQICHQAYH